MTSIEIDNETGELLLFVNKHYKVLKKLEEFGALDPDVIMFTAYKNKFGMITAVDNTRRESSRKVVVKVKELSTV